MLFARKHSSGASGATGRCTVTFSTASLPSMSWNSLSAACHTSGGLARKVLGRSPGARKASRAEGASKKMLKLPEYKKR